MSLIPASLYFFFIAARACGVALAQARTVGKEVESQPQSIEGSLDSNLTLILRSSIRSPEGNVVMGESKAN